MRRNRARSRAVTLVVVAISLSGIACSRADPAPTATPTESETRSPEGGGAAAAEYADAVCTSVVEWLDEVQTLSQAFAEASSEAANIQQVKGAAIDYFDGLIGTTGALISDVEDSGVPDVPRGEEAARHILDGLGEARAAMRDARDRIRDLATDDPRAFVARLTEITTEMARRMSSVGTSMEEFQAPELDAAAADVAACEGVSQRRDRLAYTGGSQLHTGVYWLRAGR